MSDTQTTACAGTTVSRWNQTDRWGVWGSPDQAPADPGPYREGETAACHNCGRDVPVAHRSTNERETGTQYVGTLAAH